MEVPDKNGKPLITNEMKADCIGEFEIDVLTYCSCDHAVNCEYCGGEGEYIRQFNVPWTTMKDIYRRMALVASHCLPNDQNQSEGAAKT